MGVHGSSVRHEAVQLGQPFKLLTDYELVKWLADKKMEGMLGCWALAMQEYSRTYCCVPQRQNINAHALMKLEVKLEIDGEVNQWIYNVINTYW